MHSLTFLPEQNRATKNKDSILRRAMTNVLHGLMHTLQIQQSSFIQVLYSLYCYICLLLYILQYPLWETRYWYLWSHISVVKKVTSQPLKLHVTICCYKHQLWYIYIQWHVQLTQVQAPTMVYIYTVVCAADTGTSTNYGIYTEYHNIFNLVSPTFVCRVTRGNSSGQPSSFIHTTQNGVQLVKILPSCRNALLVA